MKTRNVTLEVQCVNCGEVIELKVAQEDFDEYNSPNRRHIQNIFPYLAPAERELLISGICQKCWDNMFGNDED